MADAKVAVIENDDAKPSEPDEEKTKSKAVVKKGFTPAGQKAKEKLSSGITITRR